MRTQAPLSPAAPSRHGSSPLLLAAGRRLPPPHYDLFNPQPPPHPTTPGWTHRRRRICPCHRPARRTWQEGTQTTSAPGCQSDTGVAPPPRHHRRLVLRQCAATLRWPPQESAEGGRPAESAGRLFIFLSILFYYFFFLSEPIESSAGNFTHEYFLYVEVVFEGTQCFLHAAEGPRLCNIYYLPAITGRTERHKEQISAPSPNR